MERAKTIEMCYRVPGEMWPVELGWLYDNLSESKSHVEIGTYCGRSLLASCGGMTDAIVSSVDNYSNNLGSEENWIKTVKNATISLIDRSVTVNVYNENSINCARRWNRKKQVDSVFIDGCHEFAECKGDIEAWLPLVKPGGLICGHDYWARNPGVMDAVNYALGNDFKVFTGTRIWWMRKKG